MASAPESPTQAAWARISPDRKPIVEALCGAIRRGLGRGYDEGVLWGQLAWYVPLTLYPAGYHAQPGTPLPLCSVAATKGHVSLHLMGLGCQPGLREWFEQAWRATGCRLDMGQGCVRVRKLEEIPLGVVEEVIRRQSVKKLIAGYEAARAATPTRASSRSQRPARKQAANPAAAPARRRAATPTRSSHPAQPKAPSKAPSKAQTQAQTKSPATRQTKPDDQPGLSSVPFSQKPE